MPGSASAVPFPFPAPEGPEAASFPCAEGMQRDGAFGEGMRLATLSARLRLYLGTRVPCSRADLAHAVSEAGTWFKSTWEQLR